MSGTIPCISPPVFEQIQSEYVMAYRQDWSILKASGPGIREYLQGQITQDMDKLTCDKAIHAFILTPQGKAVSELYLIKGYNDEIILLAPTDYAVAAVARLRQFSLGYQLRIGIVNACSVLEIQGVQAAQELQHMGFPDTENEWLATRHAGNMHALTMSKNPYSFWLIGNTSELKSIAHPDLLGRDDVEAMRILRGNPRFGTDWDEKIYPMNANMIEFHGVSFDKGCYVGQEVTSRMHWRGGIKKRFYRVKLKDTPDTLPCPILTTAKIGLLTSAATDVEGTCFGIAHVPVDVAESDARLSLENGSTVHIIATCHV